MVNKYRRIVNQKTSNYVYVYVANLYKLRDVKGGLIFNINLVYFD